MERGTPCRLTAMLEPDQYTTGQNLRVQEFLKRVDGGEDVF
jgi:hypothetical protein